MFRSSLSVALLSLGLVVPSIGLAEGMTTLEDGSPPSSAIITADLPEVEAAIEAAASEFSVPLPILQAIAHTESRWQHHPTRLSMGGRQGLFQLTQDHRQLGAALLDVTDSAVQHDVATHARAFAKLLDFQRPQPEPSWMAFADIGLWRDAIIFALDLPIDFADRYVDRLFMLVAKGLIARLPSGEPIGFAPSPIDGQHLGLWSESTERNPDYWAAIWNPTSCNYSNANRTVGDVDMVIIHTVQGSYSGCISWFHNCIAEVSAHYVVSTTGEITQVVDEIDIGWHVRACNSHTIGIEHEGWVDEPEVWYTDAMYSASAGLTADILADWGLPADRNSVQGHDEVGWLCNTNHSDPGSGWDWDYYMSLIGGPPEPEAADLVGFIRHTDLFEPDNGIAGAAVDLEGIGAVTTDSTGFYTFEELDPGTYSICASATDYAEGCRTKTVELDTVNWGSILLERESGDDDDDTPADDDDDDTLADDDDSAKDDDDSAEDDDGSAEDDPWGPAACACSAADSLDEVAPHQGLLFFLGLCFVCSQRRQPTHLRTQR